MPGSIAWVQAEADVAAGAVPGAHGFLPGSPAARQEVPEYEVGVVTPYRQQKACLRETFERMAGPCRSQQGTAVFAPTPLFLHM